MLLTQTKNKAMNFQEQRRNTLHKPPLVTEVSDERENGDGIWRYLKPGYKTIAMIMQFMKIPLLNAGGS
jgi:hypothetical protein